LRYRAHVSTSPPGRVLAALLMTLAAGCGGAPRPPPWFRAEEWSSREVVFDGRTWVARHSDYLTGAGPNRWSSSAESVFTDAAGRLHLRLVPSGGGWLSAEVSTPLPEAYARVTVELETEPAALDAAVVAAAFVYRNDQSEIDVELGRWGAPSAPDAQFVVAPAMPSDRLHRFELPRGAAPVTFVVDWRDDRVAFEALPARGEAARWTFRGEAIPRPGGHRLHLALWLRERAPRGDGATEIVLRSARVSPLLRDGG
jgi:hypothetical protein